MEFFEEQKTILGSKLVPQTDGEIVAVHMTYEEYKNLQSSLRYYEELAGKYHRDNETIKNDAERKIARIRREADAEIEEIREKAKRNMMAAKQAYEGEVELNQNLRRIMKERANALRGVTPRSHDGYIVKSVREWRERYGRSFDNNWVIRILTPLPSNVPGRSGVSIRDLRGILRDLGIDHIEERPYLHRFKEESENQVYRISHCQNMETGYLEVDCYCTHHVLVPETRSLWYYKAMEIEKKEAKKAKKANQKLIREMKAEEQRSLFEKVFDPYGEPLPDLDPPSQSVARFDDVAIIYDDEDDEFEL